MATPETVGIKRIESLHYYVRDLERSRRFYQEKMDFAEVAASTPEAEKRARQRSALFQAGDCLILCSEPVGEGGRAWHYLNSHPDGVGTVVFEVEDADRALRVIEGNGGTPITSVETRAVEGGEVKTFAITTPFGDTNFQFVERVGETVTYAGLKSHAEPQGGHNAFGFTHIDHLTANFRTMKPMLLWLEHVMGWKQFWDVEFHTTDVGGGDAGSGLRSIVMYDPESGVKFANNEPERPNFHDSQIRIFVEDNRGEGIQHAALHTPDLVGCVKGLRARSVEFMPTPGSYYDLLPERIEKLGIKEIDEDIEELRDLEILVDGSADHAYLIQIFLRDSAGLYKESEAGPFFFELIQRKGDDHFGAGNFRALFESIEREQMKERRA